MKNEEVLNGIAAISAISNSYNSLKKDVIESNEFEKAACDFLENVCSENTTLSSATSLCNTDGNFGITFGRVKIPLDMTTSMWSVLERSIPQLISDNTINIDTVIDISKPFIMACDINNDAEIAATISQKILVSMLKADNSLHFHCADFVTGGHFFSSVHKMVALFPSLSGGKVYTKTNEFSDLLKELEMIASSAMTEIAGKYSSVDDYNSNNSVKIDKHIVIIYLTDPAYQSDEFARLRILTENGKRNGMSFIIAGSSREIALFSDYADYCISFKENLRIGQKAELPFIVHEICELTESEIEDVISSMQSSSTIDTRIEGYPNLNSEFFKMDSSTAMRVPFAIDKNGTPLYFEIGGNAPTHALIAGATGSGKSVALHTLITQIIRNYHPDDVEIWAIDYKAVEFAQYFDLRSPHFRVIAHDTSNEFSLSLIDLLYREYEKRQQEFLNAKVKNINEYRNVYGKHAMPRIIAIIDEFQIMTQAVQEYTGNADYRTRLENLLRLTRAMGISFILCSQTIASGLSGLSDAARDQIGCRLCLKHDDDNEIRETLMLSGPDAGEIIAAAKNLRRGQGIYKRARWANEHAPDGKAHEFLQANILYINDNIKRDIINTANKLLKNDYTPKEEVLVRGGGRTYISEKIRHPMVQFLNGNYAPDDEHIEWYPAAPASLEDFFRIEIENAAAANIMIVGENDDLRDSLIVHSLCGFLMSPKNRVVVSILDENYPDRARLIGLLNKIRAERLTINAGIRSCLEVIAELKKIRPSYETNTIYVWYGLDKLKNELFLMKQENADDPIQEAVEPSLTREDMAADIMSFIGELTKSAPTEGVSVNRPDELSFDDCKNILRQAFEVGPENNKFHMVIFNNNKSMKKSGFIELDNFENRIGTRMSADDSYDLFGSSLAIGKTDDNTVIYYAGSGNAIPLRPYLMPSESWFESFNKASNKV